MPHFETPRFQMRMRVTVASGHTHINTIFCTLVKTCSRTNAVGIIPLITLHYIWNDNKFKYIGPYDRTFINPGLVNPGFVK